jgi:hypothetical protein
VTAIDYRSFLESKVCTAPTAALEIEASAVHPLLLPHQKVIVQWMVRGGRRACFAAFGLGKTFIQLEVVRLTLQKVGGRGLIVIPLGVRQEFMRDAAKLGIEVRFIRSIEEADETGIYLTNYETVRDGKIDPRKFSVASLDEASVLRGFGGTKTFREFMRTFAGDGKTLNDRVRSDDVPYRFVATATPSPNDFIELLSYAAFLGVMDVSAAKTRFFKRDSTKADALTLHPHKQREFWLWVSSWAIFVQRPSDLGFSDEGYDLPQLDVRWHMVPTDHRNATPTRDGQARMFKQSAIGVVEASREKRDSLSARVAKMLEIVEESRQDEHFLLWHDLEAERHAIVEAIPDVVDVYRRAGPRRARAAHQRLQRRPHCATRDEAGSEWERLQLSALLPSRGLSRHRFQVQRLHPGDSPHPAVSADRASSHRSDLHRSRIGGPSHARAEVEAARGARRQHDRHHQKVRAVSLGDGSRTHARDGRVAARRDRRREVHARQQRLRRRDAADGIEQRRAGPDLDPVQHAIRVLAELRRLRPHRQQRALLPADGLPHAGAAARPAARSHRSDSCEGPHRPGRDDRPRLPGRLSVPRAMHRSLHAARLRVHGDEDDRHRRRRENNQTYRLGWTEQCKDGSKMGVGMPEYLLLFRKPPSDNSRSYADVPVVKSKAEYSRSRWQIDAHGFMRSNGDRPLTPEDLVGIPHERIFKLFREYSLTNVYDFEHHVRLGEELELRGTLPVTFMLLQPQSWSSGRLDRHHADVDAQRSAVGEGQGDAPLPDAIRPG